MWREKITADSAINIIKNKRKCIEINLGFLFQLSKWEEFNLKENKLFIFSTNGNISLLGINDYIDVNFNENISSVLVLHNKKLYKICNEAFLISNFIEEKMHNFIEYLKILLNYPNKIETFFYSNGKLQEENFKLKNLLLENNLSEEITKYFSSC